MKTIALLMILLSITSCASRKMNRSQKMVYAQVTPSLMPPAGCYKLGSIIYEKQLDLKVQTYLSGGDTYVKRGWGAADVYQCQPVPLIKQSHLRINKDEL